MHHKIYESNNQWDEKLTITHKEFLWVSEERTYTDESEANQISALVALENRKHLNYHTHTATCAKLIKHDENMKRKWNNNDRV